MPAPFWKVRKPLKLRDYLPEDAAQKQKPTTAMVAFH
jgi:hypothetical protein